MIEETINDDIVQDDADLSSEALVEEDEVEAQVYELGFHILPSVEEEKVSEVFASIKALLEKHSGIFISEEFPKQIDLAYTIVKDIDGKRHKENEAYFGWVKFEMKTNDILNVKEGMDDNKEILRFLIIKTVKESTLIPKGILSPKEEVGKSVKSRTPSKSVPVIKNVVEKKKVPVSDKELDKTIEELIVD